MEPNFEQIKKLCYCKGALDALIDAESNMMINSYFNVKVLEKLRNKYKFKNILSNNKLDEARQKLE